MSISADILLSFGPADETEFAEDQTFGYVSPTLSEYIEEKTKGGLEK